jgi:hypothetical protein
MHACRDLGAGQPRPARAGLGRRCATAALLVAVASACGGGGSDDGGGTEASAPTTVTGGAVTAVPANFDLAAGSPQAFLLGLIGPDQESIAFGTVQLSFAQIGTAARPLPDPRPGPRAEARFVAISGDRADADLREPRSVSASDARGVYRTEPVTFPDPGFWEVTASFTLDGNSVTATATFEVLADHEVPAPGDEAPRTEQALAGDPTVPAVAVDSRAQGDDALPDPELHAVTVADALDQQRPLTVVISTPAFCTSRFCGPVTDTVAAVGARYSDRMAFVHLEVWSDFENQQVSPAAAEWIARGEGGGNEPWVFVVDSAGIIAHRFDNVVTESMLTAAVEDVLA